MTHLGVPFRRRHDKQTRRDRGCRPQSVTRHTPTENLEVWLNVSSVQNPAKIMQLLHALLVILKNHGKTRKTSDYR